MSLTCFKNKNHAAHLIQWNACLLDVVSNVVLDWYSISDPLLPPPLYQCWHSKCDLTQTPFHLRKKSVYWALSAKDVKRRGASVTQALLSRAKTPTCKQLPKDATCAFIPKPGILRLYLYRPSYLGFLISKMWLTVPYIVVMGNNGVTGHKVSS